MDLKELQQILAKDKYKIVIVENGKPVMVVAPYEDDLAKEEPLEIAEELSGDIGPGLGELTIDDLPL